MTTTFPAGNLNLGEATTLSLFELLQNFPDFFYYTTSDANARLGTDLWKQPFPVRAEVLDTYSQLHAAGKVVIERHIDSVAGTEVLPNIVELTMWWMGFMHMHGGSHGYRSYRTPSSTPLNDGRVVCVALVANEFLWVRPNIDGAHHTVNPAA